MSWITRFNDKEFHAPYKVAKESDYYDDLRRRLTHFINKLKEADADEESIRIAKNYSEKVCESIRDYNNGNISSSHQKIENLIKKCNNHKLAVEYVNNSRAFPGKKGSEIQFYRARKEVDAVSLKQMDMLHIPFSFRGKSGNYRFSIPGVTSLYLANTSYGCWIEMGKPSEHDFYVSPVVLDGKQRIFNLAVATRILYELNDGSIDFVHCWVKLLILMMATSYKIEEGNRSFKSEYIVSQSIMLACKKCGYDGVAYFSKQVEDELFAFSAVNLALFVNYRKRKEYGEICEHIKVDEPLNYQLYRQLRESIKFNDYQMRIDGARTPVNINGYTRPYSYKEMEFYRYDKHLFARWLDKDMIIWGNALQKLN